MIIEVDPKLSPLLFRFIGVHKNMMEDKIRVESYNRAIKEEVKKGDVVLDIGTGTGILAFFSVLAGAKKVYAVESAPIISLARKVARYNELLDKIEFLRGNLRNIDLPEKVDLIVTETLGHFAIDENIVNTLMDARKRFLKKQGKIIPRNIKLFLAPVDDSSAYKQIKWDKKFGIDFSPIDKVSLNKAYLIQGKVKGILANPEEILEVDLRTNGSYNLYGMTKFKIKRTGCIYGLRGWFYSQLSDSVAIDTSPFKSDTIWQNVFFPVEKTINVTREDVITIEFWADSNTSNFSWKWKIKKSNN